jgi:phosphohistidine phosphatase
VSGAGATVYFLRHGVAAKRGEWTGDDDLRPLTDEGRAALARAAGAIARLGIAPAAIVTSPLVRARETAEIAGEALGAADKVAGDERLAPGFDAGRLVSLLADHPDAAEIVVVGHEPDLSRTIAGLTGGAVVCKKGSLARVDLADRSIPRGTLVWLLQPRVLGL